jgi:phosphoribosyl 1,2-cyclic phosphodiesterase
MIDVTFHGVRGSTPCHDPSTVRYGGNTSCVSLSAEGQPPLVLDLGTGLRYYAKQIDNGGEYHGVALVSHLHWDHVQGLPFFPPMLRAGSTMAIYGPMQEDGSSFASSLTDAISPPTFPIDFQLFAGEFTFHSLANDQVKIGDYSVMSRVIPHIGSTLGFRITLGDVSIAYIPDHQQSYDGSHTIPDAVRELVQGADLLIHDSQYLAPEFAEKYYWGHCTPDFAVAIANECKVKSVALFHHDPNRTDAELDTLPGQVCSLSSKVFVAAEGMRVSVG